MKTHALACLSLAAALVVAACESAPPTLSRPSGSLVADYAGHRSGRLAAEGGYRGRAGTTYAIAYDLGASQEGALHIGGEEYRDSIGQSLVFTLNAADAGEYSFASSCDYDTARCAYGLFQFDDQTADLAPAGQYEITGGSVTITSTADARVRGTFSVQARLFDPRTLEYVSGGDVSFAGGSFDVPVIALNRN